MTDLWHWADTRRTITPAEARFISFDRAHPEVWQLFERFAFDLLRSGFQHHSADAVLHRVRWETDAGGGQDGLKINNDYAAFYARKFHRAHPRHAGFFRTRRSQADEVAA